MSKTMGAVLLVLLGCATPLASVDPLEDAGEASDGGLPGDAGAAGADGGTVVLKPLPRGVYSSIGGLRSATDNPILAVSASPAIDGVGLWAPWDLCGDDEGCLFGAIRTALDAAAARGLKVALAIADGANAPPALKARCQLFDFTFRNQPSTMCLAWDPTYLSEKTAFVRRLGTAFDAHPALGYVYFTGACSTNGVEGHCRVSQRDYTQAGYTAQKLAEAYGEIMGAYREGFPSTPVAVEVHAIFGSDSPWNELWQAHGPSGRVGIAAWWCAERLSVLGLDTVPVFPLVQAAARSSFSVCQTVASFSREPFRFSEPSLGLDYGSADGGFSSTDVERAFAETLDWMEGKEVHAGQSAPIVPFAVYEPWAADADRPSFQPRLEAY